MTQPRYCWHGRVHYGRFCDPVLTPDGKTITGPGGGPRNRLIRWTDTGQLCVVPSRPLRLLEKCEKHEAD